MRRVDHVPGVEHVAVPQTAELSAVNVDPDRSLRLDVGHVVDVRVRVRLDGKLVGPERMNDVERGYVERDQPVRRELELVRLHAAVLRIAVGELPLLGDHLDLEWRLAVDQTIGSHGNDGRGGPLTAAGAVDEGAVAGVAGQEQHDRDGDDHPPQLHASVPADGRTLDHGCQITLPEDDQ